MRIPRIVHRLRNRAIGRLDAQWYTAHGLVMGERVHLGPGVRLDPDHCWLITLEDDVTLAPDVTVLAHDASTKHHLDLTFLGAVTIKARAFVGAGTTILPGVTIGEDAIVGAGSLVTKDVPARSVAVGSPATTVHDLQTFLTQHRERMGVLPVYDESWTTRADITAPRRVRMRQEVTQAGGGYVV